MITVAILGIILAIAGPTWMRQREQSRRRACQEILSKIDGAKEQWGLENNIRRGTEPGWDDLCDWDGTRYIKASPDNGPECPSGFYYQAGALGVNPTCLSNEEGHEIQPPATGG